MGKASSSKKVARAASAGGSRTTARRRPWNFYGAVLLVLVLGLAGTAVSRHDRNASIANAGAVQPTVGGTPWHEALAVDICGTVQPNITTTKDPVGITTNGDGVIQIHPFKKSAAGRNATLGKFASSVGMKLDAAELQLPGGKLYRDGDKCNGQPGHVYVKEFAYPGSTVGTIDKSAPDSVRLADGHMLTVAFVPAGQKGAIPAPPKSVQDALTTAMASSSTTSTSSTTPGAPTTAPATTAPATTAPATTAPATTAPATTAPATTAPPTTAPATTATSAP
ncbi:MAG TPA: hypothetical protein VFP61_07735 [Acidimicrobiales bacterium]|nr:hypothetical protein [Acidimicrobiales bacterium]